jgi:hypothetical protein
MYPKLTLYIDGQFIEAGDRKVQDVVNPANCAVLGQLPHASEHDLEQALQSAHKAFQSWKKSSPMERSAILRKVAQLTRDRAADIARAMTLDQGKPLAESMGEVISCADHADWHAEECRRIYGRVISPRSPDVRQFVLREPIGVCVAFTPWNFPYNQAIRKVAAAIGAGCTIVLKGPEDSPSAVMAIAQMLADDPRVDEVFYPGLPSHPGHELAGKQMSGFGGMLSFRLATGAQAKKFVESTTVFTLAESLGGVESLVNYPCEMTHASVRGTELEVPDTIVRLSVGIESVEDLLADVRKALDVAIS